MNLQTALAIVNAILIPANQKPVKVCTVEQTEPGRSGKILGGINIGNSLCTHPSE